MMNQQTRAFATGPTTHAQQQGQQQGQQQANRKPKNGNGKSKAWQASQNQMWAQLSNTKMCKYMVNGTCSKGASCNFAHSKVEIQALPDLSCTKLCKTFFKTGVCDKPGCMYAHNKDELRATSDFHKTKLCRFWPMGNCELGSKCRFAHASQELRPSVADQKAMQQRQEDPNLQNGVNGNKEIDANGRLVVIRDAQRGQDSTRSSGGAMGSPCYQDGPRYDQQDQLQSGGGYPQKSGLPKAPPLPHYPPPPSPHPQEQQMQPYGFPFVPHQQQEPQMQHQPQQPSGRRQRLPRQHQSRQYPPVMGHNILAPGGPRSEMKNVARVNQPDMPPPPIARSHMASDEDPHGFGDSDYDPTGDYGVESGGSEQGTPPQVWSMDPRSGDIEGVGAVANEEKDEQCNIPPLQDGNMVHWAAMPGMPGMQGQMQDGQIQGQPMGMIQIPGQPMVPVWGALPNDGGQIPPGQQQQYGNGGPQAMAVPYAWRPMIGVMMAPNSMPTPDPNRNPEAMAPMPYPGTGQPAPPVGQCEDGSWQVKNTFLTYSPDSGQMYPLRRVNSATGVLGSYESQDEPWMG